MGNIHMVSFVGNKIIPDEATVTKGLGITIILKWTHCNEGMVLVVLLTFDIQNFCRLENLFEYHWIFRIL